MPGIISSGGGNQIVGVDLNAAPDYGSTLPSEFYVPVAVKDASGNLVFAKVSQSFLERALQAVIKPPFAMLQQLTGTVPANASTNMNSSAPVNVSIGLLGDVAAQINMGNQRHNTLADAYNDLARKFNDLKTFVRDMGIMTNGLQAAATA